MGGFMTGLAIGFGLGVVFAPMSGVEVRSTVVEKTNKAVDSGRSMAQRVKSAAGEIGKVNPESRAVEA
jgi:gas vesicle protein